MVLAASILCTFLALAVWGAEESKKTTIIPGKVVLVSRNGLDCFYFAGTGCSEIAASRLKVSFRVEGLAVEREVRRLLEGYWAQRIQIDPAADSAEVTIHRSLAGGTYAVSTAPTSDVLPDRGNVIFVLTQGTEEPLKARPGATVAADSDYPRMQLEAGYVEGDYRLPPFETKYKYSDILVNLNLQQADFREVLMLMSEISGVSIILDPYWSDEPTGGRRPPGGPGGGGELPPPGEESYTPPGEFRGGEVFQATIPREGIGSLTMNLQNVPFDLALDLILTAVNLVKIDVYPGFFDQKGV